MVKNIKKLAEKGEIQINQEMEKSIKSIFDNVNGLVEYLKGNELSEKNNLTENVRDYLILRREYISLGLNPSHFDSRIMHALETVNYNEIFKRMI